MCREREMPRCIYIYIYIAIICSMRCARMAANPRDGDRAPSPLRSRIPRACADDCKPAGQVCPTVGVIHTCMHTYMHTCINYTRHVHTYTRDNLKKGLYIYIVVYVIIYIYIYTYVDLFIYVYAYVCVFARQRPGASMAASLDWYVPAVRREDCA